MEINIQALIFQIINFAVLTYFLSKLLYKPILNLIRQRQQKINEGLALAEQNKQEKQALEEKKKQILNKARKEALKIVEQAKKEAQQHKTKIIKQAKKEAKQEAEKMIAQAKREIKQKETQLTQHISELVISTTEKLLNDLLTTKEKEAITKRIIDHL